MHWEKRTLLFAPDGQYDWIGNYAAVPIADHIADNRYRIYFSGRDLQNRSHPGFIEIDITAPHKILSLSSRPPLLLGATGTFDDAGVMFSWIVTRGSEKYAYYIGWNRGGSVPFRNAIGLAVSRDGGQSFERYALGPILDRGPHDPGFTASCCVLVENDVWRMWYLSCVGWDLVDNKPRHRYHIKYAESIDGIQWRREGIVCIDVASSVEYAISRPSVIREDGLYKMWYSYRGHYYRIGYAESQDGIRWTRRDDVCGLDVSEDGWDSEMVEYPFVFDHNGRRYLLYNGNGYGKSGLGYALLQR